MCLGNTPNILYYITSPNRLSRVLHRHSVYPPGATQPIVSVYFTALYQALASSFTRLLDHIQRRAAVDRTPLNE
jgi:hypothetical protein